MITNLEFSLNIFSKSEYLLLSTFFTSCYHLVMISPHNPHRFIAGIPNLQDLMHDDLSWNRCMIIKIKCIVSVMCLNHPQTVPCHCQSMEKLSSMKMVPRDKEVGD